MSKRHTTPWLCGNLDYIKKHFASIKISGNRFKCEVCGELTSWKCGLCNKYLCMYKKKQFLGGQCVFTYHNDSFFGLSKSDYIALFVKSSVDWLPPPQNKIQCNAMRVETIKEGILEE